MDKRGAWDYTLPVMLKRCHRYQESLVRYWARQAVFLCDDIDDESLQEHVKPLEEAIRAMERERRVLFFGGKGCGKSALLSKVAGCPAMAKLTLEGTHVRWRFRCDDGDAAASRFLPDENLEGLELVDTQACDVPDAAEALRSLLPGSDVAVAVVDGRRYAESPVWDIIGSLPEGAVGTVMIALTFTDSLSAEATLALSAAIREFCHTRFGSVLPAYAVSPASDAAVESFTTRVQEALAAPGAVRAAIRRVLAAGVDLMYKQGSVLKTRENVARTDSGFLAGIEQEIDNFLSHQMLGLQPCRDAYADSVRRSCPRLLRRLRWTFGWTLSPVTLLRLELLGAGTEKVFYHLIRSDVSAMQQESDQRFCLSCSGHWRSVRPRMKQTLECEIGDFPEEALSQELDQLRSRLEREMHLPFREERFRASLSESFKQRAGWMRGFIVACCVLLTLAGLLGFLGQDVLGIGCVALAVFVWTVGTVAHLVTFTHLRQEIEQKAEALHASTHGMLGQAVESLIVSRVAAYRRLYTVPRRKVAEHEATLKPLQERHGEIFRQLRGAAPRV